MVSKDKKNKFFEMAATDMEESKAAVQLITKIRNDNSWLNGFETNLGHLIKALETAAIVSYSRPFKRSNYVNKETSNSLNNDLSHLTDYEKGIHKEVLDIRDSRYAHSDIPDAIGRFTGTIISEDSVVYMESVVPLKTDILNNLIGIAEKNRDHWRSLLKN